MHSKIKYIKFKEGLPLEIEIIPIADTILRHQLIISRPHRAEFYHIFWIQKGTAEYQIDFEPVKVGENSFLFVNKNRVQVWDNNSRYDGKLLLFTDSFFAEGSADTKYLHSTILFNDFVEVPIINVASNPSLQSIFAAIEGELQEDDDEFHYHLLHNLLHNLLLHAERERRKQGFTEIAKGVDFDYTVLFKDLVEEQFRNVRSVVSYASQMNVSEKRLTKAVTKTVGKSPKTVIDERVMLEAKRLLIHTSLSIKEVGYKLGFEEATNFIKYFRKHLQQTPIEFRESYLGG